MANQGFFRRVWKVVAKVPYGKVVTYGQIAALLGQPRAARIVGWAMRASPRDVEIPWHRVINSRGGISFERGEHGRGLQRQLLEQEGVIFNERGLVDLDRFQWRPTPQELAEFDG